MSDRYLEMSQSNWGKSVLEFLGLPTPPRLKRATEAWQDRPLESRAVLVGAASSACHCEPLLAALADAGASLRIRPELPGLAALKPAAAELEIALAGNPAASEGADRAYALVFDASGIARPEQLRELYDFFQPLVRDLPSSARVLILGSAPQLGTDAAESAAAGALTGFMKGLAKEIGKKGSTCNLLELSKGAAEGLAGPLRFMLSPSAAFISGQTLRLNGLPKGLEIATHWTAPLAGKTALVTGAARGIGAAIAQVLAREGAQIVGLDHPSAEGALGETMSKLNGSGMALDITAKDAPARIAREFSARGIDVLVHNAGITRDKMLRNMQPHFWDQVLEVNLASIVRVNEKIVDGALKPGARMVCISSIGGIAGNAGQTNYGATKSGVIAYVAALAPEMARRGGAVNAVAPGFIETQMTASMPAGVREVGRRLNSLSQGGLPVDIAEAVAFFSAGQHSGALNGGVLRVCGQSLVGA